MAIKKYNPTSPARRFMTVSDFAEIRTGHVSSGRGIWVILFNSHDYFSFTLIIVRI